MDSRTLGSQQARSIPVVDIHELAAGKLAALLSRRAGRDLYDSNALFSLMKLDPRKLRLAFVVYGAMNRKDWRTVSASDIDFDADDLRHQLLPTLREDYARHINDADAWARELVANCQSGLNAVLPLSEGEMEFLNRLLDEGVVEPALITDDGELADRIATHPMVAWKAVNVRRHRTR